MISLDGAGSLIQLSHHLLPLDLPLASVVVEIYRVPPEFEIGQERLDKSYIGAGPLSIVELSTILMAP